MVKTAKQFYDEHYSDDTVVMMRDYAKMLTDRMYSEEDMKLAYFSAIQSTGEGWNGEYAEGNNPNIEDKFSEEFKEWFEQFKKIQDGKLKIK